MNIPAATEIADNVQQHLDNKGRTKRWLSDESGIPYPTLNRKMAGKAEFKLSELLLIAELLDGHPSELLAAAFKQEVAA